MYPTKIRKNPITNEWEHSMIIDNSSDSIWVPGLYGFYDINSVSQSLQDIYNTDNNVIYRENIHSGIIKTPITKIVTYSDNQFISKPVIINNF